MGVRLSAKHSGKQMSNPYLISMRVVKWSFNPHVGLAHGSPGVHGFWECERSESRGPALGAGNATLKFCRTHKLLAHAEKDPDERAVQGLGGGGGRTDVSVSTSPPPSCIRSLPSRDCGCFADPGAQRRTDRAARTSFLRFHFGLSPKRPGLCPANSVSRGKPFRWPQ